MFTDVHVSDEDLKSGFREFLSSRGAESRAKTFSVMVLTAGSWPIAPNQNADLIIPQDLLSHISLFSDFYGTKHSGRKLTWLFNLSRGELVMSVNNRRYEIQGLLFQLAVLLLFNDADSLSFDEILQGTRLSDSELRRICRSLVDTKIVLYTGVSADFSDKGVFRINDRYANKHVKIKISAALQAETPQEQEQTIKQVDDDRRLFLQAAVVRIMKARRALGHNQLVQEVIEQARNRFNPNVTTIKYCIEQLIDKQYLERDDIAKDRYRYIA